MNHSRAKSIQVERKMTKKENSPTSKLKVKEEGSSPVLKMIPLDHDRTKLRSPSPPSEYNHAPSTAGVRYSQREREYALRYIDVLLERDHQMPIGTMARDLCRKVNKHCCRYPLMPLSCYRYPTTRRHLGGLSSFEPSEMI